MMYVITIPPKAKGQAKRKQMLIACLIHYMFLNKIPTKCDYDSFDTF